MLLLQTESDTEHIATVSNFAGTSVVIAMVICSALFGSKDTLLACPLSIKETIFGVLANTFCTPKNVRKKALTASVRSNIFL